MTPRWVALVALLVCMFGWQAGTFAQDVLPDQHGLSGMGGAGVLLAQAEGGWWPPYPQSGGEHDINRGPGGYFSLIKLLLILVVFLVWVRLTDWMNRDALKFGEHTGMTAEIWNPINIAIFLAGFAAVLTIPQFLAGYPVYLATSLLPWTIYLLQRRHG